MTLGAVGISCPSAVDSFYFVLFLVIVTLWSCGVQMTERRFGVLRIIALVYSALHLIAVHLMQFEFAQHFWDPKSIEYQ